MVQTELDVNDVAVLQNGSVVMPLGNSKLSDGASPFGFPGAFRFVKNMQHAFAPYPVQGLFYF